MTFPFPITQRRFAPTDITGLQAWYRSDLGVTKDGSNNVSAWADQSGNGRTLTEGTNFPLWVASGVNGRPTIRFDGVNDRLGTVGFTVNQPYTLFMIMKVLTFTDAVRMLAYNSASALNFPLRTSPANSIAMQSGGGGEFSIVFGTSFGLFKALTNGTSSALALNNGADTTSATNETGAVGQIQLANQNGGSFSNIEVAELLLYGGSVANGSSDYTNLLTYLKDLYSLW